MVQQSEVISLLMALALTPVMYTSVRRIEFAGKVALMYGLGFMLGAYVFTLIETFVAADVFNFAEHLCLAGSGVAFAIGVVQLRSGQRAEES